MSYIVDFLRPLLFFLVGYAILKDFHTCLAENSSVENSIGDAMTIDQWDSEWYFTSLPTQHMSIIFFPAWIYMIQIHSGKRSQRWDSVACSVAQWPHASKLTHFYDLMYGRSTCSISWRLHALYNLLVVADTLNIAKVVFHFTECPVKQQDWVTLSFVRLLPLSFLQCNPRVALTCSNITLYIFLIKL